MKLLHLKRAGERGSVLALTLVTAGILGLTLSGYLYLVRSQNLLVAQSQAWNAAMALAEAGVEDAMAQINVTFGTNYISSINANWGAANGGLYGPRSNTLTNGSYSVIVIPGSPGPTIISTGTVHVPIMSKPVVRVVRVTTTTSTGFGKAISAQQNIVFNGNDVEVDSYDSADPLHSTNGMYYAPSRKAGGDVTTTEGTVTVKNAQIKGKLRTGPDGSYEVGANGSVGDLNFAGPGIQEGYYDNDFNMEFKQVTPPLTSGFTAPTGTSNITYVLGSGGYIINGNLSMKTGDLMEVLGHAVLYVAGDLNMLGVRRFISHPAPA